MKNKNTVIALLVIFTLICGYNLYWTYVQFNSDSKLSALRSAADEVTNFKEDASTWTKEDSATVKEYRSLQEDPDFQSTYNTAIDNSFTLGLDLQGGMFVTMEIGIEDVVTQLATNPDSTFTEAVACATLRQETAQQAFVPLFVECIREIDPDIRLGTLFSSIERNINFDSPDEDVVEMLNNEATAAIDRSFEVMRQRIEQFGVVSPNLQKQPSTGRILLELPGVKEPERVKELLQGIAKLEFWTTHDFRTAFPVIQEINERLKVIKGINIDVDSAATDTTTTSIVDAETPEEASVTDSTAATAAEDSLTSFSDVTDSLDPEGTALNNEKQAEQFRRENPLFALLSPPRYENYPADSRTPLVGYASPNDTAAINDYLAMEEIQALIPDDMRFVWGFKPFDATSEFYELIAIRTNSENEPSLSGERVNSARQNFDDRGRAIVDMSMDSEGSQTWSNLTGANVGSHVAVLLDNYVYSYPVVNQRISGGRSQISGNFTIDEAQDLANVLRAGQLPVKARIEGEDVVGPTLGRNNIFSGLNSFLAAFLVTLVFMIFYYSRAGIIANVALLANLVFILGCSAAFTIVLTLPGIAAVVLTVGMAVDANVLIFERIREEQAKDKTLKASIKAGFSNAFSSVMDANITTFLTGVVLYAFGVGPIRGFAVSLMIGIITSLISALIITRLILDYYADKGKDSVSFGTKLTTGLFSNLKLNMIAKKRTFYMVSASVVVVSLISFGLLGFKTGVDFDGGRQFTMAFFEQDGTTPHSLTDGELEELRGELTKAYDNNAPIIKTLGASNRLQITTSYKASDRDATKEIKDLRDTTMGKIFSGQKIIEDSFTDVGPTVASDIRAAAFKSVIFSLIIIFLYILIRFRKWQYSAGAIAAVFHDVIIVLGIFSLLGQLDLPFSLEVNQALIAALLTIIGYSINDTVVVFDRIRENIQEMKASKLSDIYNLSIDQTISRTLITSFTTFLTALILFIWGGDVIRGFVFAIMVGIVVGTYSSIFVASPISLDLIQRESKEEAKA